MNLTKEYLKLKFKEYNQIYFEGKLRLHPSWDDSLMDIVTIDPEYGLLKIH